MTLPGNRHGQAYVQKRLRCFRWTHSSKNTQRCNSVSYGLGEEDMRLFRKKEVEE